MERLERRNADVQEMAVVRAVAAATAMLAGIHGPGLWQEQSLRYFYCLGCANLN
jgi:hypothetical protein